MDFSEQKGGIILCIIAFIISVLKLIGLIKQKEDKDDGSMG
jgi:hypothetical protein